MGKVCSIFSSKSEEQCAPGLPQWEDREVFTLVSLLATMIILLACIANNSGLILAASIANKFEKNDKKYPAHLAKGSSAKVGRAFVLFFEILFCDFCCIP
jgi:hypothetical protein